ncbi:MAG: NAD-dependent epimerase/dehydratase family protein [Actinomycetes bacterium]
MRALVTGAAGFIGSHLAESLTAAGWKVRGVDAFTDYYDVNIKRANVTKLQQDARFELVEADLTKADLVPLVEDVDVVFHQAGQPGVRLSWSAEFPKYVSGNVLATQRLLEACRDSTVDKFVYASSSSIYGNTNVYPTTEEALPAPYSPYGVTKLAGEHLCRSYAANWGLRTVSLRYFTVYGPRQRPDMAMHRFLTSALTGAAIRRFGDGEQVRDFTYVHDVVRANMLSAEADVPPGTTVNIAGGGSITVNKMIELLGELVGAPVKVEEHDEQPGDVRRTGGSIERARELLGWVPKTELREGLAAELDWLRPFVNGADAVHEDVAGVR